MIILTRIILMTVVVSTVAVSAATAKIASFFPPTRFQTYGWMTQVVATTPMLAEITDRIGGNRVYVVPLLKTDQNISHPRTYRSMRHAVQHAKLIVRFGGGLDPWVEELARNSGNKSVVPGAIGDVDASLGIHRTVDVPYWRDKENVKVIASNILTGLSRVAPKDSDYFTRNYQHFLLEINSRTFGQETVAKRKAF